MRDQSVSEEVKNLFASLITPEMGELDDELTRELESIARRASANGMLASGNTLVAVANQAASSFETRCNSAWRALKRSCDAFGLCISSKLHDEIWSVLESFIAKNSKNIEALLRESAAFRSVGSSVAHDAAMEIFAERTARVVARLKAEVKLATIGNEREMRT